MPDKIATRSNPARPAGRLTRRRFLKAFAGAAVAVSATGGFSYAVETKWLQVEHVDLPIAGLAPRWEGQRIVQLSDLHASPSVDPGLIRRAFGVAQDLKPAFIAVTGDWVTRDCAQFRHIEDAVKPVVKNTPVVGTLGNHDHGQGWNNWQLADEITRRLRRMGVQILRNTLWRPYDGPGELCMVGLDDVWSGMIAPWVAVQAPYQSSVIILSHNPDTYDLVKPFRWHAMLSGHTHGGQVVVPGYGPLKVPVKHTERYAGMYYPDGERTSRMLYINRGVGHVIHFRLFCPPEVTCFTLRSV